MDQTRLEEAMRAHRFLANRQAPMERAKNDRRVTHEVGTGYYWGRKYAWRVFGMMMKKHQFAQFLAEIGHPTIPCLVRDSRPNQTRLNPSIAYLEDGLRETVERLVRSSSRVSHWEYRSPHFSMPFSLVLPPKMPEELAQLMHMDEDAAVETL